MLSSYCAGVPGEPKPHFVLSGWADSVFVRFPETDMEATFKIAEEAALKCTEIFRKPIE